MYFEGRKKQFCNEARRCFVIVFGRKVRPPGEKRRGSWGEVVKSLVIKWGRVLGLPAQKAPKLAREIVDVCVFGM